MPLQRKINRTRSIARMNPGQRTAGSVAARVKAGKSGQTAKGVSSKVKSARPKMTPQPAGKGKPKATGRPGTKRVPAPAMTTNKRKVY